MLFIPHWGASRYSDAFAVSSWHCLKHDASRRRAKAHLDGKQMKTKLLGIGEANRETYQQL